MFHRGCRIAKQKAKSPHLCYRFPMPKSKALDPAHIEKKLRLAAGLYELAFKVKKYQLQQKFPELSDRELNHKAYALIERGCK